MKKIVLGILFLVIISQTALGNVVINGTRIIYQASSKDTTVLLNNTSTMPSLVQSWITSEDLGTKENIPFIVTPPVFRMEPKMSQNLRIIYTGESLPQDRESLYYLNILDIPPKPSSELSSSKNYLQIAIQSKLKLFFRPDRLEGQPAEAHQNVEWTVIEQPDHTYTLRANNKSSYYVTYNKLLVTIAGKEYQITPDMVAPKSQTFFNINGVKSISYPVDIKYSIINDYGANVTNSVSLK